MTTLTMDFDLRQMEQAQLSRFIVRDASYFEFVKEAETGLVHYEKTGLHVTQSEVSDWIQKLQLNANAPAPLCHT